MLVDKAYARNALDTPIVGVGTEAVIPCNTTRRHPIPSDVAAYKIRHTIERRSNKLKLFRRIASRFDRRAVRYFGYLHIAAAMLGCGECRFSA